MDALATNPKLRPWPVAQTVHKPVFGAFLVCCVVSCGWLFLAPSRVHSLLLGAFVLTFTASALVGLARRLPAQNVITSALLLLLVSFGAFAIGAFSGVPFGAVRFTKASEPTLARVPVLLPVFWAGLAICVRGVARLPLRPWRKTNHYGYWMIVLSIVFAVLIFICAEPICSKALHFWIWSTRPNSWTWYGTPWSYLLGCVVTLLSMYVIATPWLINKQPVKHPVDYQPLLLLNALGIYVALANVAFGLFVPAILCGASLFVISIYAVRGASW